MNIPRIQTISVPQSQPQPSMFSPSVKIDVTSQGRKVAMSPVRATMDPELPDRVKSDDFVGSRRYPADAGQAEADARSGS